MNNQKILISAVAASMVLPSVAFAAIDDQGMAYVSASEGLSGRIQMRWEDTDEDNVDGSVKLDTLRLYLSGDLDIGGGMKSTYYTEIRDGDNDGLTLHAYDIGLTGAFGSVNLGRLDGVTDRMVPGGSLDEVAGSSAESPTDYPDDNGFRYESPSISGLKFGFSSMVEGSGGPDGSFDGYNAAISYSHPIGVTAGFGIEKVKEGGTANIDDYLFATGDDPAATLTVAQPTPDAEGYRLGMRYAQAGWTVGYEYRTFEAFNGFQSPQATLDVELNSNRKTEVALNFAGAQAEYKVHRFAAQFKLDRVTASVNYSKEISEPEVVSRGNGHSDSNDSIAGIKTDFEPTRTTLGADVAYSLGSKSRIAIGFKNQETETVTQDSQAENFEMATTEVDTFILDYQVNF